MLPDDAGKALVPLTSNRTLTQEKGIGETTILDITKTRRRLNVRENDKDDNKLIRHDVPCFQVSRKKNAQAHSVAAIGAIKNSGEPSA